VVSFPQVSPPKSCMLHFTHIVYYVSCNSHNKYRLFPRTALTGLSFCSRQWSPWGTKKSFIYRTSVLMQPSKYKIQPKCSNSFLCGILQKPISLSHFPNALPCLQPNFAGLNVALMRATAYTCTREYSSRRFVTVYVFVLKQLPWKKFQHGFFPNFIQIFRGETYLETTI
jgi:hypothetical protein